MLPVGITLMFSDNEDHSNHAGRTWERTSVGRVPVGIDTTQAEFNTIGKTGGAKVHKHLTILGSDGDALYMEKGWPYGRQIRSVSRTVTAQTGATTGSGSFDYTAEASSLSPYEVFAFWKRTA